MLYISCPTCRYFLGHKIINFEKDKEEICSNQIMTKEEKENAISKLLLNLKLRRICCKMRIMTYKDIVQDILPVNNEKKI
jgi:DNA-directed RNA polymerase subunit N (RpoN/RPB10)